MEIKFIQLQQKRRLNEGITDFRQYFKEDPDFLEKCIVSVKVLNINTATLDLLRYKNKKELFQNINKSFNEKSYKTFINVIIAIADKKK